MEKRITKQSFYPFLRKASVLAQNTTTVFLAGCSFSYLIVILILGWLSAEGPTPFIFMATIYGCALSIFFFRPKGPILLRLAIVISLLIILSWWFSIGSDILTEPSDLLTLIPVFLIPISSIPAVVFNQK